jgi:hypothetical protein
VVQLGSKASIVVCLLGHFVDNVRVGAFTMPILCNKVVMKKEFSDETHVSYIGQSVRWASASILLLVCNNKISLARAL